MARVSIGVPVFNGGSVLRDSLECLRTQTFEDFEVTIGDNASTDAQTADLCAEYAARDSRFTHLRRPHNIGMMPNFYDLQARAEGPLFMWRAYDDLSDAEYIARLVALHDTHEGLGLAVPRVRTEIDDRREDRVHDWQAPPPGPRMARIAHFLEKSHASWVYGLWCRSALTETLARTAAYADDWASDHLMLLSMFLEDRVAGTNKTEFRQRILRSRKSRSERIAAQPGVSEMRRIRQSFDATGRSMIDAIDWQPEERDEMERLWRHHVNRRSYSRSKLFWAAMRALRPGRT